MPIVNTFEYNGIRIRSHVYKPHMDPISQSKLYGRFSTELYIHSKLNWVHVRI